jgi:alpha-mannosidase
MSVDANNLVLTAMKKTEDGDGLVLRFYEWAGETGEARIDVPAGATSAGKANLMEEVSASDLPLKDGNLTVPYHPFEILSIRLSYPEGPTRGE